MSVLAADVTPRQAGAWCGVCQGPVIRRCTCRPVRFAGKWRGSGSRFDQAVPPKAASHTALMQVALQRGAYLEQGASHRGDRAMPNLVEMFAAAILVVMILAIVAIATGFLPSRTG